MRKLLAVLCCCACAAPLPTPDQPGAGDTYRAVLSVDSKGPRMREARDRLEELEWDDARAAHTVFAYRRFLKEFEDSRHAPEARSLLEGLRWEAADRDGSMAALAGYLDDEPRGAHAGEAWARLTALRLAAALQKNEAEPLRIWLAENPLAPGREQAQAALDELDFRAAQDAPGWRRYLDEHLDGAHRAAAQAKLSTAERDEAALLEDEPRLLALQDPAAADIAYLRAAALLDEGRLGQLARKAGPHARDAARDLAALRHDERKAALLEQAAHKLFLPRATLDELPEAAPARAQRLREWALALDGSRLHRMLGELASPRASVALAALDSAEALLQGLPAAEARVRAERELAALRPVAVDAPQLTGLAVLDLALGRGEEALEAARAAAARNAHCAPAVWLAARLEQEKALQQMAMQGLRAQGRELGAAHADAARAGDAAALAESCAALRAVDRAAEVVPEARPEALALQRQVEEGARHATNPLPCPSPLAASSTAGERLEAARALIAAGSPLARPALARAAARDPDPRVRAAVQGAVALGSH